MTQRPGDNQENPPVFSRGWLSGLKEALLGGHQDFTEAPITRAIVLLAVPMVLEMCMESLFGVVDIFFVSHVGADAIAAIGLTESVLTIVYATALGLSIAATATVARRIGEKDPESAAVVAVQAIVSGVVLAVILGVAGAWFAKDLLRVMGASESLIRTGYGYTRTIFGGCVVIFLLFLINAVFRGAGDPAIAMRSLWLANIVNICLNPCLIFGLGFFPRLGVTGSAVGTTIGRSIGVLYQIWMLTSGNGRVSVKRRHLRIDLEVIGRLFRLSLGGILQYLVQVASWIGLVRIVSTFGSGAIAGYTLSVRMIVFAILPSWGLSNAAATMVGQNLGAGKPGRAERAVWITGFYNMLFLGSIGVLFISFTGPIVAIFTSDPAVAPVARDCLRYLSYGYVAYAYGMVISAGFNGAGDTVTPTSLNFLCFWICQIPLAYWLAYRAGMGPRGTFLAVVVSDSLLAVLGILLFRRGTWKLQKV